jgi:zinc protease
MSGARAVPPVLREPPEPRLPPVLRHSLRNGLDVFIVEQHALPVADVRFVVRAGAGNDDPATAGCTYLTTDLLDEGTATRGAPDIADQAELLGASLSTSASWDYSAASLHVLTPHLPAALELLADIVTAPAFASHELERKRAERIASILQEQADPHTLASHAFADVVFGSDHPYGHPIGGRLPTVRRLSTDHVRQLYAQRFTPANAFLVVVGAVDAGALGPLLDDLLGGWCPEPGPPPTPVPQPPTRSRAIHIVHRPGAPQSELRIGHAGPPRRTPDYFPLYVANTVLGGTFSSRLNMLLRQEKAYTYGAGSAFAFRAGGGPFLASTAVATAATADAVVCTVREIERLTREPVGAVELARSQSSIVLGLPRTFETTGDIAEHVSQIALHDLGWDYYDRYGSAVRAVTAGAVQSAAARWLRPEGLSVVIAGDAERIVVELETTGLGAVHVRDES